MLISLFFYDYSIKISKLELLKHHNPLQNPYFYYIISLDKTKITLNVLGGKYDK